MSVVEALSTLPRFPQFIDIPEPNSKLLQHEVLRISKTLGSTYDYLHTSRQEVTKILESKQPLEWFKNGKAEITRLLHEAEAIDIITSQLLAVVDDGADPDTLEELLSRFEQTSDMLLELKKQLLVLKETIDVAINYEEITCNIMKSLTNEILLCGQSFLKILKTKISSPKRHLPKFNLVEITSKMKINDIALSTNSNTDVSVEPLRLPTFNDADECLYNDYLTLDARMKPLKVSLDFLPLKISEFNHLAERIFPQAVSHVQKNYDTLVEAWNDLQAELRVLKRESVDKKWVEIFSYLVSEISKKCDDVHSQLKHARTENEKLAVVDAIGSSYKLCSNTITIISKAFSQGTVTDQYLAEEFNGTLVPKWEALNSTLLSASVSPSSFRHSSYNDKIVYSPSQDVMLDDFGLRVFQTSKRDRFSLPIFSLESISKHSSQGFDVGIPINRVMSGDPFSIEQKKVIDLHPNIRSDVHLTRKSLSATLMMLNRGMNMDENDDISSGKENQSTDSTDFAKQELFKYLCTNHSQKATRLPLIREDYARLGLPVIQKMLILQPTISSIPSISPNHPVFQSPLREPESKQATTETLKPPPEFALNPSKNQIVVQKRRKPLAPSTKYNSTLSRMSSLTLADTPNLAYDGIKGLPPKSTGSRSLSRSIRSTSPERPDSSMGSRFDEVHLIQPVKTKSAWR